MGVLLIVEPIIGGQPALAVTTQRSQRSHGRPQSPRPARSPARPPGAARRTAGRVIEIILVTGFAILVVAPIYWALVTSLRTPAQSFTNPPDWIPAHPMWSNYSAVFSSVPFWNFLGNSFLVTGLHRDRPDGDLLPVRLRLARLQFRPRAPVIGSAWPP